ncbi:MAG: DUF695 domain-containing protein [Muribaculaceae bacterium]|nr:DUF695 domain-containing protein [Muribaculaceae bacterium]
MAKLKLTDEWWTSPAEADNGALVMVTGRRDMEPVIATGKYNYRIEITWKYEAEQNGMPDVATSTLMEEVQDALQADFMKDPVAVLTGIYTGNGERNWVFYAMSVKIFERKLNEDLARFELLPLTLYVENDPEWSEYQEMREATEILDE